MSWLDTLVFGVRNVQVGGVSLAAENTINLIGSVSAVDNPGLGRTDVTFTALTAPTGSGLVHVTGGSVDATGYKGSAGQMLVTNAGGTDTAWVTMSQDGTLSAAGALAVGQLTGFAGVVTIANGTKITNAQSGDIITPTAGVITVGNTGIGAQLILQAAAGGFVKIGTTASIYIDSTTTNFRDIGGSFTGIVNFYGTVQLDSSSGAFPSAAGLIKTKQYAGTQTFWEGRNAGGDAVIIQQSSSALIFGDQGAVAGWSTNLWGYSLSLQARTSANLYVAAGNAAITFFEYSGNPNIYLDIGVAAGNSKIRFAQNVVPFISQDAKPGDTQPSDFTITTQAPFASATTAANKTPGSLIADLPAIVSGGNVPMFRIKYGGSTIAHIGPWTASSGYSSLYLLASGVAPTSSNFTMIVDNTNLSLNASSSTGAVYIEHANVISWSFAISSGQSQFLIEESRTSALLRYTKAVTNTSGGSFTIQGQDAKTGGGGNGGTLALASGAQDGAGTAGTITLSSGAVQRVSINDSGTWTFSAGSILTSSTTMQLNGTNGARLGTTTRGVYADHVVGAVSITAASGGAEYLSIGSAGQDLLRMKWTDSGAGSITFDTGKTSLTISQADKTTNGGTGAALTIQAQNETGTTSTGGDLALKQGTGTTTDGSVLLGTTFGKLSFIGSQKTTQRAISGNLTVDTTTTDYEILVDTSAARTITLPPPTAGRKLLIKDKTGSAATNNITIARNASEKIEGVAASYVLNVNWIGVLITSDGTDWFVYL